MPQHTWWKRGIVYQIYPMSFQDSDGDGNGDLNGIRRRLDYLRWLGVDAIWLSPIYPSPMADFGYDVSDHCAVAPRFGTMDDFDRLVAEAHEQGLRVIMDFVPNHTSDRHPWFRESRASRDNARRDWYIWRDPAADGGPPNNWLSNFGGSAWEWDAASGQYYYHAFLKQQPDLNWRNRAVRQAMYQVLKFWLDRGVDGFRVDVLWHLVKDDRFRDDPPNPTWREGDASVRRNLPVYSTDRPEIHQVIAEMREVVDRYDDRLLIGEIYLPIERLVAYYGEPGAGVHLPFNFHLIQTEWNPEALRRLIEEYDRRVPEREWPNWVLGNHDNHRIRSRIGSGQARVAAMLLLTLRGTPTMYYGDEIGMVDAEIPPERVQDPWGRNEPGLGLGRDPQRTPMQWDGSPNAGFSDGCPWLPVAAGHEQCNVHALSQTPDSLLWLYKRLIDLRRQHEALIAGRFAIIDAPAPLLVYERRFADERLVVALNLSAEAVAASLPGTGTLLLSTGLDREEEALGATLALRPNEGVIADLTAAPGP